MPRKPIKVIVIFLALGSIEACESRAKKTTYTQIEGFAANMMRIQMDGNAKDVLLNSPDIAPYLQPSAIKYVINQAFEMPRFDYYQNDCAGKLRFDTGDEIPVKKWKRQDAEMEIITKFSKRMQSDCMMDVF